MSVDGVLPAVYDPERRRWVFTRQYGQGTILRPLGASKIRISAANSSDKYALSGMKNGNGTGSATGGLHVDRARKWNRYLMHDIPELAPALDLLPDFIEESHIITASTEVHDPTVGRLMDAGSAAVDDGDGEGEVGALVYAMGGAGSGVGVGRIVDEEFRFGVGVGRLIALGLDRNRQGEEMYRVVGKIRQVCTAKSYNGKNSPLLALRTPTSSTVLTQEYASHLSKFTLTPHFTIPISSSSHSDLSFSPYNPRHLGIVDESGEWAIRDIHHSPTKHIVTGSELVNTPYGHSWGKIHWGKDENSLIVSNRARVGLFDIRAQLPGLSFLPINTSITRDWVLDTSPLPPPQHTHPYHAIILTSSQLLYIDTRMPGKRLLSQDHYRHPDDVSLKMELFTLPKGQGGGAGGGEETTALIYSRMNPLVSAFQMGFSEGGWVPVWLDNPYLWRMDGVGRPVSLSILPSSIEASEVSRGAGKRVVAVSCWTYDRDGVVRSRIYTSEDIGEAIPMNNYNQESTSVGEDHMNTDGLESTPSPWGGLDDINNNPRLIHTDFSRLYKYIFTDTFEDPRLRTAEDTGGAIEEVGRKLRELILPTTTEKGKEGNVDGRADVNTHMGGHWDGDENTHGDGNGDQEGRSEERRGLKTLLDLHTPPHLIDDLPALSNSIKALLDEARQFNDIEITKNLLPSWERFPFRRGRRRRKQNEEGEEGQGDGGGGGGEKEDGEEEEEEEDEDKDREGDGEGEGEGEGENTMTIQTLYTILFQTYISPLPPNIPTRVRLHRERLVRGVATEVWLASRGVLTIPKPNLANTTSAPSTPKSLSESAEEQDEPALFSTLQKYTPLSNFPNPTSSPLPNSLSRILSQWTLSEDPSDLEYTADGLPTPKKSTSKSTKEKPSKSQSKSKGKDPTTNDGDAGRRIPMFCSSQPAMFAVSSTPATPSRKRWASQSQAMTPGTRMQTPMTLGTRTPGTRNHSPSKSAGGRGVSMSQVERGKFGGGKNLGGGGAGGGGGGGGGASVKKKRKQGF